MAAARAAGESLDPLARDADEPGRGLDPVADTEAGKERNVPLSGAAADEVPNGRPIAPLRDETAVGAAVIGADELASHDVICQSNEYVIGSSSQAGSSDSL